MASILKNIIKGLGVTLPLGITLYLIYWLFSTSEALLKSLLLLFFPEELYFPGLGIFASLAILFAIGLLMNAYGFRYIIQLSDKLVARIPIVKSVYGAVQDILRVFTLSEQKDLQTVVSLDIGNNSRLIGFVTGKDAGKRLFSNDSQEIIGVYLPMSYQVGGYTVYVEASRLTTLDIPVEEALRMAITGGAHAKD